jgi:hypothetical protein
MGKSLLMRMYSVTLTAAFAAVLLITISGRVSAQGCTQPSFTPASPVAVGSYPAAITNGDFNGDGDLDLATANYVGNNVSVLIGNGTGGFTPAVNFGNVSSPFSIAAGDLDNDGNVDLVTANSATNNLTVWLGNGSGGFSSGGNFGVGSTPYAVYIADLNSDGNRDLLTANYSSNSVSVLLGNGAGGFSAAVNFNAGQTPISVAFADLDLNGTTDLAIANNVSHAYSVLSGNGDGTFGTPTSYSVGSFPQSIATGDFNGDGRIDIAAANSNASNISVRLNLPAGGFGAPVSFAVGNTPFGIAVADLNFDGNSDIVTSNFFSSDASVLLGLGDGQFEPAINFSTGTNPGSVTIGDLNGDGSPDLAISNTGSNNVSVLLNNCTGNSAPTISTAATSRQKGAVASRSVVATANDAEEPETDLTITVNNGTTAAVNGVTVSNLTISDDGSVQADVSASCSATDASFTLRVTDNGGLFAETTLNVTVTASNAPVLGVNAPISLFPHNGKMHLINMDQMLASASDDCDGDLSSNVVVEQVTSDEVSEKEKDKEIVIGSDCKTVSLRATRDHRQDGRVYSIRLRVTDADGNTSSAEFKATVPIGPNTGPAVEGPAVVTVSSSCQ